MKCNNSIEARKKEHLGAMRLELLLQVFALCRWIKTYDSFPSTGYCLYDG